MWQRSGEFRGLEICHQRGRGPSPNMDLQTVDWHPWKFFQNLLAFNRHKSVLEGNHHRISRYLIAQHMSCHLLMQSISWHAMQVTSSRARCVMQCVSFYAMQVPSSHARCVLYSMSCHAMQVTSHARRVMKST